MFSMTCRILKSNCILKYSQKALDIAVHFPLFFESGGPCLSTTFLAVYNLKIFVYIKVITGLILIVVIFFVH